MGQWIIGAATAAHQVEGNNIHSDYWAMEHMKYNTFSEPSLDAVDHYHHYEEDIQLLAEAGLNAYRFSIEWARIEPEEGIYDQVEIEHYRKVLLCCKKYNVEPIVTMMHFTSPKWLIEKGGWENDSVILAFEKYCSYIVEQLGDLMNYVCTINEANMGIQIALVAEQMKKQMQQKQNLEGTVQVGMNLEQLMENLKKRNAENVEVFGVEDPQIFVSPRTLEGDQIVMKAHVAARYSMKKMKPELKVGITLSLHDIWVAEGGEENAEKEWDDEFTHYLPYIQEDDFLGLQNYSKVTVGPEGSLPTPEDVKQTQMGYENYPQALERVIRRVSEELPIPILVTENGIATADDGERAVFIKEALAGVKACCKDGIPVLGYLYWSLLDNFEWQKGYSMTFGLIGVDRKTQKRYPKESLYVLGACAAKMTDE